MHGVGGGLLWVGRAPEWMTIVYSPDYAIDIGDHVFPTRKYRMVHAWLRDASPGRELPVAEPGPASWDDLLLVHTPTYLSKIRSGDLSLTEQARLEIPWSASIATGFRLMTGGTVTAARSALQDRVAVHIGGGFHHAFPDHWEGFCVFNDVALACRMLLSQGLAQRVVIVDCDVHHGNGTAKMFEDESRVFTFSIHQVNNYPTEKPPSTLDVGLADGTGDQDYLRHLERAMPVAMAHKPDVIFYLAGADPYVGDRLGGLALTKDGLRERDRRVVEIAAKAGVPLVVTLAGGYAEDVNDTIAIHVATIEEALHSR